MTAVGLARALRRGWRPAASWLAAAGGGGGAVVADLLQPDGDVRQQDQVVVAEDDLDLGAGQVQAQRPAGLGGGGGGSGAGRCRGGPPAAVPPPRGHKTQGIR